MSYTQFGYSYPSSSQLLMTGQHPSATPCCQSASPADPHGSVSQPSPAAAVCTLPAAYDSRLLSTFPRLATGLTVNGLYGSSYPDQSYVTALGTNPPAFYSSLPSPYDLKESRATWAPLPQATAAACYPYDPTLAAYGPYGDRYGSMDSVARRKNATRETTNTLKAWLYEHRKNPYPTKGEKIMLAIITKMTLTQVSTWFANARRRLKKENKMTWEPRNKTGDSTDVEEKGDNSSAPSPSDNMDSKSQGDSLDECPDEDSQDIQVKAEANPHTDSQQDISDLGSCSVKSESSDVLPNDCLSLTLSNYGGHHHHHPLSGCSPNSDSRTCGTPSPGHPHPLHHHHHRNNHHHPPNRQPTSSSVRLCSDDPMALDVNGVLASDRPKIWSLAHTATSESPPMLRRSGSLSQMVMTPEGYMMMGNTSSSSSTSSVAGTSTGGSLISDAVASPTAASYREATAAAGGGAYTPEGVHSAAAEQQQASDLTRAQPVPGACWLNNGDLNHQQPQALGTGFGTPSIPRDCVVDVGRSGNCGAGARLCAAEARVGSDFATGTCEKPGRDCSNRRGNMGYGGSASDFDRHHCAGGSSRYNDDSNRDYGHPSRDCGGSNMITSPLQAGCPTSSPTSSMLPVKTMTMFESRLNAGEPHMFSQIVTPNSSSQNSGKSPVSVRHGLYGAQVASSSTPPLVTANVEYCHQPTNLVRGPSVYIESSSQSSSQQLIDLRSSVLNPPNVQNHQLQEKKDYSSPVHTSNSIGANLNSRYSTTAFRPVAKMEANSV